MGWRDIRSQSWAAWSHKPHGQTESSLKKDQTYTFWKLQFLRRGIDPMDTNKFRFETLYHYVPITTLWTHLSHEDLFIAALHNTHTWWSSNVTHLKLPLPEPSASIRIRVKNWFNPIKQFHKHKGRCKETGVTRVYFKGKVHWLQVGCRKWR